MQFKVFNNFNKKPLFKIYYGMLNLPRNMVNTRKEGNEVGMRGIAVVMYGIRVGMRGIRVGMPGIGVEMQGQELK